MSEKYVLQRDTYDCGLAALKTIFLQFGKRINIEKINYVQGLTAYDMIQISKKNGLVAKGVRTDLFHITSSYLPCIAHVIKDKSYFHYIVITKNNKKSKKINIFDPAEGFKEMNYENFEKITTNIFIIFNKMKFKKEANNRFQKTLIKIFKTNKFLIISCVFISFITITLSLLSSFYLKFLIKYEYLLIKISIFFLILSVTKNFICYQKNKLLIKLNKRIDNDISKTLITHIFNLPYSYYQEKPTGYLITIINDIENFKSIVIKIFIVFYVDLIYILLIVIFLIWFNIYYLLIIVLLIFIKIVIAFFFQNKYNDNYLNIKSSQMNSTTYLINILENIKSIKNLRIEKKIVENVEKKELKYFKDKQFFNQNNNKYIFINAFIEESMIILVMFLSIFIKSESFSLVNLIIFTNIYQLTLSFLNNICEVIIMYKTYLTSINKILDVFDEKEEKNSNNRLNYNLIECKNVSYSIENINLLNEVSFKIEKNDMIFIEGASGVGKTTLVKLIFKYKYGYDGTITFDNINSSYINEKDIRRNVVYVSNSEKLFIDTIYNNLSIVNSSENKISSVIKICKIDEFMNKKNIDSNYVIDNLENNLSGGEKNKILIARALLTEANIIIFDEIFNEIDSKTERTILKNIKDNFDVTILFISHRKENIDLFNKHYKIQNKKLIKIKEEKNDRIKRK